MANFDKLRRDAKRLKRQAVQQDCEECRRRATVTNDPAQAGPCPNCGAAGPGGRPVVLVKEVIVKTRAEFLRGLAEARAAGHEVLGADDLGGVDVSDLLDDPPAAGGAEGGEGDCTPGDEAGPGV